MLWVQRNKKIYIHTRARRGKTCFQKIPSYLFQKACSTSRICSSCSGSRVILLSSDAPGMPAMSFRMRLPNFSGANRPAIFSRVSMASFFAAMEAKPHCGSRASREASSASSRHSSIMIAAPASRARWKMS